MQNTIKTNERIFQVTDFEGNIFLCNIDSFSIVGSELMCNNQSVKSIKHYWNFKFKLISKLTVKQML